MGTKRGQRTAVKHAGFTLRELVVVICIIVLLVTLSASYAGKSWRVARRVHCMSNMRQVAVAYFSYAAENDGKLPRCDLDPLIRWRSSDSLSDLPYLRSYIGDPRVFHCPEDLRSNLRTYAVNDYLGGQFLSITHVQLLQRVMNPVFTLLLVEEQEPASRNGSAGGFVIMGAPATVWADAPGILHESGSCLCFVDGHVECWHWEDSRTVNLPLTAFPKTPDNADLIKLQNVAGSVAAKID